MEWLQAAQMGRRFPISRVPLDSLTTWPASNSVLEIIDFLQQRQRCLLMSACKCSIRRILTFWGLAALAFLSAFSFLLSALGSSTLADGLAVLAAFTFAAFAGFRTLSLLLARRVCSNSTTAWWAVSPFLATSKFCKRSRTGGFYCRTATSIRPACCTMS